MPDLTARRVWVDELQPIEGSFASATAAAIISLVEREHPAGKLSPATKQLN